MNNTTLNVSHTGKTDCSVLMPPYFNTIQLIIFLILNFSISLLAILGNLLVIMTLYCYPKLRKRSNYFLLYLSITDIAVGIYVQPLSAMLVIDRDNVGDICLLSQIMTYSSATLCGASFSMLTLISYDRFLHLSKLNNYNKYMTSKKLKIYLAISWSFPPIISLFLFHKATNKVFNMLVITTAAIEMAIITVCYYKSWKIVQTKTMSTTTKTTTTSKTDKTVNKYWKVTRSMTMIVIMCLVAWTPLSLFTFFQEFSAWLEIDVRGKYRDWIHHLLFFCLLCGYTNSCVNPFLYYWRNKELRSGIKKLIFDKTFKGKLSKKEVNIKINFESSEGVSETTKCTLANPYVKDILEKKLSSNSTSSLTTSLSNINITSSIGSRNDLIIND